jgi:hypothetical protein
MDTTSEFHTVAMFMTVDFGNDIPYKWNYNNETSLCVRGI